MAVGTKNIKRLHQLIRAALKRGASVRRIVRLMQEAVEGHYHARGYDDDDIDLISLVHDLGGSKLLYAVSHATGLPSLRTLKRKRKFTYLRPCVGAIQAEEIDFNLCALFGEPGLQPTGMKHRGWTLQADEVAVENRPRYLADCNSIVGGCREHVPGKATKITGFDAVDSYADQLEHGKFHMAGEVTVLGISPHSDEDYHVRPIIMSATCKTETAPQQAEWIALAIKRWKPYEATLGPLWSVATDGDSIRRTALHQILMEHDLDPADGIYNVLGQLLGLNLQCSSGLITQDSDVKHILKSKLVKSVVIVCILTHDSMQGGVHFFGMLKASPSEI